MASQGDDAQSSKRKPRPSRGRGLRTTTGCLTCRSRRLKCSEERPTCSQCLRSERECSYSQALLPLHTDHDSGFISPILRQDTCEGLPLDLQSSPTLSTATYRQYSGRSESASAQNVVSTEYSNQYSNCPDLQDQKAQQGHRDPSKHVQGHHTQMNAATSPVDTAISPTQAASVTSGRAPYECYQALKDSNSRWSFEPVDLSKSTAPSPSQFLHSRHPSQELAQQAQQTGKPASVRGNEIGTDNDNAAKEPWNTSAPTTMPDQELGYLKYYIDYVGPILDMFDPTRTFTEYILHLAMRNVGLLKSVLAVSARFKSLHSQVEKQPADLALHDQPRQRPSFTNDDDALATQFYFETLNYLAKAMQYQSYTRSQEILATVALISSYELFHVNRSTDWERHLKGVFWIQRSQKTNGECEGLRGAVWWNWLHQDIWAALWQNRMPLTIWEPTKSVSALHGHEFVSRATYLLARAIKFATKDTRDGLDVSQRFAEGEKHLQDLQEWYTHLPPTYRSLPNTISDALPTMFPPVWIHPSFHAAAMQNYYSAKVLILLNQPSIGGRDAYHDRQHDLWSGSISDRSGTPFGYGTFPSTVCCRPVRTDAGATKGTLPAV